MENEKPSVEAFAAFAMRLRPVFSRLFLDSVNDAGDMLPGGRDRWVGPLSRLVSDAELESPIEAVFLIYWHVAKELDLPTTLRRLCLVPQIRVPVDGQVYRTDFMIVPNTNDQTKANEVFRRRLGVAVELDGHEFHEKSKEQVASRNARDRALQRIGFRVVHFSGSEVVKNPMHCVREAVAGAEAHGLLELAD